MMASLENTIERFCFRLKGPAAYGTAVLIAVAATGVRLLLPDPVPPFILFFVAAGFSSLVGGLGPGLLTVALCTLASRYFLLPPVYSFRVADLWSELSLGLYILASTLECLFVSLLRRFITHLGRAEAHLRTLIEALPQLVWTLDADGTCGYLSKGWDAYLPAGTKSNANASWEGSLHPEDRAKVTAAWRAAAAAPSYQVEYRLRRSDGTYRWLRSQGAPIRDSEGRLLRWIGACTDITDLRATEAALREHEGRLAAAVEAAQLAPWYVDVSTGGGEWSSQLSQLLGLPVGRTRISAAEWREFLHPDDRERVLQAFRRTAEGRASYDVEYRVVRTDGELRWLASRGNALRDPDGRPYRIVGVVMDITERKAIEDRQRLLMQELDHRARNLLAVVQSILQLTKAADVETYSGLVKGRVLALARAHGLLSAGRWTGASLARLIDEELDPYRIGTGRIATSGPAVGLRPTSVQSLALALHELTTNAVKHGALSRPAGRLAVSWSLSEKGLNLVWNEFCAGGVERPMTQGFGSAVIRSAIEQQLGGRMELEWHRQGLKAQLWLPRDQLMPVSERKGESEDVSATSMASLERIDLSGKRVLIVEDESLVAMMIEMAVNEANGNVVGPAATLEQALSLASTESIDAAILDGNLGGASSAPVARLLRERGVPFVIATGYAGADVFAEFDDAPRVAKPFVPDELVALIGSVSQDRAR